MRADPPAAARRVLVIKLGALGDMVLAQPALARIRAAHPQARLTLLTTPPFAALAEAYGLLDAVETDGRPATARGLLRLVRRLRRARYDRIYDLQTSSRSSALFQMLRPVPPPWSGIARGCALPHRNPQRDGMHTLERQADQLRDAGIWPDAPVAPGAAPPPRIRAPEGAGAALRPAGAYALLVPGGSAHRPAKRWPAARFAELARELAAAGVTPVVLGGAQEAPLAAEIAAAAPATVDLTGRTTLLDIAGLGAGAAVAVGGDTGPMHLAAAAGAPAVSLFSAESDPALCAPRDGAGVPVRILRAADLADLPLAPVLAAARELAAGRRVLAQP